MNKTSQPYYDYLHGAAFGPIAAAYKAPEGEAARRLVSAYTKGLTGSLVGGGLGLSFSGGNVLGAQAGSLIGKSLATAVAAGESAAAARALEEERRLVSNIRSAGIAGVTGAGLLGSALLARKYLGGSSPEIEAHADGAVAPAKVGFLKRAGLLSLLTSLGGGAQAGLDRISKLLGKPAAADASPYFVSSGGGGTTGVLASLARRLGLDPAHIDFNVSGSSPMDAYAMSPSLRGGRAFLHAATNAELPIAAHELGHIKVHENPILDAIFNTSRVAMNLGGNTLVPYLAGASTNKKVRRLLDIGTAAAVVPSLVDEAAASAVGTKALFQEMLAAGASVPEAAHSVLSGGELLHGAFGTYVGAPLLMRAAGRGLRKAMAVPREFTRLEKAVPELVPIKDELSRQYQRFSGAVPKAFPEVFGPPKVASVRLNSGEFAKLASALDLLKGLGNRTFDIANSPVGSAVISTLAGAAAGHYFGGQSERDYASKRVANLVDPYTSLSAAAPPSGVSQKQYESLIQDPTVRKVLEYNTRHRALTQLVDRYLG